VEQDLGGEPRGVLSWALGRALQVAHRSPDWRFHDLLQTLRSMHQLAQARQRPELTPASAGERSLGAFLDGGPAHVPWRGVSADFQLTPIPTNLEPPGGGPTIGWFVVTLPTTGEEQWHWNDPQQAWPAAGFRSVAQAAGWNPPGAPTYRFTNFGFSGPPSSTPPTVAPADRVYLVDVPGAGGALVVLIARMDPVTGKPTAMDWYTTSNLQFLPVNTNDVLDFNPHTITATWWSGFQWTRANEQRKP
jgi:hypothetical protein